ncbi:MAG TPA: TonB family protein [Vicinamibacterales bacterium]|jgi:TonB family protein
MKLTLAAALVVCCAGPAVAQDSLAAARTLYASASYEEALAALSNAPASGDANQVDEYRALCYLALGESSSATQALERIVKRAPLYELNEIDVSPKLVASFNEVRQRVLPDVVRQVYTRARESYEAKNYGEAAKQFRLMLSAIDEIDRKEAGLSDLRTLGDGFLKLSEAAAPAAPVAAPSQAAAGPANPPARAAATQAPPAVPAPAGSAPATAARPTVDSPAKVTAAAAPVDLHVYTATDIDVKPPIAINQVMPRWIAPSRLVTTTFTGSLEVLVDEKGTVESVGVLQGTGTAYDAQLVEAARKWRYQPAMRGGVPVKYRRTVGFVLRGQGQTQPQLPVRE